MKLSENTINALKNFSGINTSFWAQQGKLQKSMKEDKTILAEAIFEDAFPMSFGIYDLPQFLANITTLDKPELTFHDNHVVIDDGSISVKYFFCAQSLITMPPEKSLEIKNPDLAFDLPQASFNKLLKIASLNNLPTITVAGKNGKLLLKSHEASSDTSNYANMVIGDHSGDDFEASFKVEYLRLIPDDYRVAINKAGFALFENKAKTLKYFIALEKK